MFADQPAFLENSAAGPIQEQQLSQERSPRTAAAEWLDGNSAGNAQSLEVQMLRVAAVGRSQATRPETPLPRPGVRSGVRPVQGSVCRPA